MGEYIHIFAGQECNMHVSLLDMISWNHSQLVQSSGTTQTVNHRIFFLADCKKCTYFVSSLAIIPSRSACCAVLLICWCDIDRAYIGRIGQSLFQGYAKCLSIFWKIDVEIGFNNGFLLFVYEISVLEFDMNYLLPESKYPDRAGLYVFLLFS